MATEPSENIGTKLLFENERVRVWELAVAPGETLEQHIHRNDYVYLVPNPGVLRFSDPDNPANDHDHHFVDNEVRFVEVPSEGRVDNHITNVGEVAHRNYIVELLPSPQSSSS